MNDKMASELRNHILGVVAEMLRNRIPSRSENFGVVHPVMPRLKVVFKGFLAWKVWEVVIGVLFLRFFIKLK